MIDAEDIESWGGQIVTSDTIEMYENAVVMRKGTTILDNVEIYNCSQIDTVKTAVRFQSASSLYSEVTNSVLHNGYSWGIMVKSSANILIKNNILLHFRPIGLAVWSSNNVTVDGNIVAGIVERTTIEAAGAFIDKTGAISICAYMGRDTCSDVSVTNNLVAGSSYAGFLWESPDCGADSSHMAGNIAHSIKGTKAGHGLYTIDRGGN